MLIKTLLAGSAAATLIAGAAMAQDVTQPREPAANAQSAAAPDPATTNSVPVSAVTPSANVASSSTTIDRSGAAVTTEVITNGPVPDTPQNRARYGQPMSNAGKVTAPKGN